MDPELQQQFEDQIRQMTEMLSQQNSTMASMVDAMNKVAASANKASSSMKGATDAANTNATATQQQTKYQEAQAQAQSQGSKRASEALDQLKSAAGTAAGAIGSFTSAALSGQEGLSKYGSTVGQLSKATSDALGSMGMFGKILGAGVEIIGQFVKDAFVLVDNIANLRDGIAKTAGALPVTTTELYKLAGEAKYYGENMQKLQRITSGLGTNLVSLGATAGQGATKFMQMAAVSDDTRKSFMRLGISQERLTEMQAMYVRHQQQSGETMSLQNKTAGQLRKESLAYAENLVKLSSLTGKQAEELQAEQEAVKSEYEELMQQRMENERIKQLQADGNYEAAAAIKKEQENRIKFLDEAAAVVGKTEAARLGRMARTGVYDEFTSGMAVLGISASELKDKMQSAADGAKVFDDTFKNVNDSTGRMADSLGMTGQFIGEEGGNQLGMYRGFLEANRKYGDLSLEERKKQIEQDIAERKNSKDPMADMLADVKNFELEMQKKYSDFLMNSVIPKIEDTYKYMQQNFDKVAGAATALAVAAAAAAAALGALSIAANMKTLFGSGGGLGGKGGGPFRDPKTGRFAKAPVGKIGRGVGIAKGIAGGAATLVGGLALDYGAEKAEEAGYEKTSGALGVGSAALTGAGLGATLGSVVPGLGTVAGGAIGGALGGLYGLWSNRGKLFGDSSKPTANVVEPDQAEPDQAALQQEYQKYLSTLEQGAQSDSSNAAQLAKISRTGVYDEFTAGQDKLGISAEELKAKLYSEDGGSSDEDVYATRRRAAERDLAEEYESRVDEQSTNYKTLANNFSTLTTSMKAFREIINLTTMALGGTPEGEGGGGATPPGTGAGMQFGGDMDRILATIRKRESGGDYTAQNPESSASGAYQFIDSTWQSLTKKYGIGQEYKSAKDAPPAVQDQIAMRHVQDILSQAGGDISKVPVAWFTGNIQGKSNAVSQEQVSSYASNWLTDYNAMPAGPGGLAGAAMNLTNRFNQMAPGMGGNASNAVALARNMLGASEKNDAASIQAFLKAGGMGINPTVEAWCAAFVNSALQQSGLTGTGSAVANSFQNWGTSVPGNNIQPGDVVLETRGKPANATGGHVGLATGQFGGGQVEMIAGNTGNKVQQYSIPLDGDVMIKRASGIAYGGQSIPQAEGGGILRGPDSGYPAILHGTEMVVPLNNRRTRGNLSTLEQLMKMPGAKTSSEYTVNGKRVSKKEYDKFMNAHPELQSLQNQVTDMARTGQTNALNAVTQMMQGTNASLSGNVTGIKEQMGKLSDMQDRVLRMVSVETNKAIEQINDSNKPMQIMSDLMTQNMSKMVNSQKETMNMLSFKIDELIDALNTSNDTTKKILKKAG